MLFSNMEKSGTSQSALGIGQYAPCEAYPSRRSAACLLGFWWFKPALFWSIVNQHLNRLLETHDLFFCLVSEYPR